MGLGIHFSLIRDEDLIRVDHNGNVVDGGKNRRLNYGMLNQIHCFIGIRFTQSLTLLQPPMRSMPRSTRHAQMCYARPIHTALMDEPSVPPGGRFKC